MKSIVLPVLIVVGWLLLITGLSTSFGAWSHSQSMIVGVLNRLDPALVANLSPDVLEKINFVLRKLAHFSEYAVLFSLVYWLCCKKFSFNRAIALPIILVSIILFAISDEVHQSFVPGRTPQARDVLIDSLGAATAAGGVLKFDRPIDDAASTTPEEKV